MAGETPITVVGNLTGDPELHFTPQGVARCRFTVASTPRTFDKQTGKWADGPAMFLGVTAWRSLAEHVAESAGKGTRVVATGRLRQHHWTTDTGENRSMFGLDADDVGVSLLFATARPVKAQRSKAPASHPPDDAWTTAASTPPAAPAADDAWSVPAGTTAAPPF